MISRVKQLASITAVGAGAIALTSGKAEAATIIVSSVLDTTIGYASNAVVSANGVVASNIFNTFASGPDFAVRAGSHNAATHFSLRAVMYQGGKSTSFAATATNPSNRFNARFAFGATWGSRINTASVADLGIRAFNNTGDGGGIFSLGHPNSVTSFTDEYFLFIFRQESTTDFGWIEASMSVTGANSVAPDGPDVTIVEYAFDNSGADIYAGEGAGQASPEPSSLAESGLAALILGAEGLRRWRKARNA